MKRLLKHLSASEESIEECLSAHGRREIERAIAESEKLHSGEICFAIEAALTPFEVLKGVTPRRRAVSVFSELQVWNTRARNGVLIYVLVADRDFEIVADVGFDGKIAPARWEEICHEMEQHFHEEKIFKGITHGIRLIGAEIGQFFPPDPNDRNELSNKVVIV